jgi:DNA repair photolyase
MAAVKQLVAAGIPCGILMAPILPGISDSPEQLRAVVRAAAEAGATHLTPLTLHLRPGVKEEFMPWLEEAYPELVAGYRRLYRGSNAPRAVRDQIGERVRAEKRRHRTFASRSTPTTARRLPDRRPDGSTAPGPQRPGSAAPGLQPRDPAAPDPRPRDSPAPDPGPAVQLSLGLG